MTPIELGLIALFVAAFLVFMLTLFLVTWYVEKDAAPMPTKSARHGQSAAPGSVRHA
ncbi:MAG: hypothetical protein WAW96_06935 [Alphaproteobacteria bacterium]